MKEIMIKKYEKQLEAINEIIEWETELVNDSVITVLDGDVNVDDIECEEMRLLIQSLKDAQRVRNGAFALKGTLEARIQMWEESE